MNLLPKPDTRNPQPVFNTREPFRLKVGADRGRNLRIPTLEHGNEENIGPWA